MTKQEALNTINASFPSIWSREDVLQLVNKIDGGGFDTEKLLEKIRKAVENGIDGMSNDEIVDISSCEFDIHNGNEIQIDSVGINTSDIVDAVMTDVVNAIEEYIEETQEEEA